MQVNIPMYSDQYTVPHTHLVDEEKEQCNRGVSFMVHMELHPRFPTYSDGTVSRPNGQQPLYRVDGQTCSMVGKPIPADLQGIELYINDPLLFDGGCHFDWSLRYNFRWFQKLNHHFWFKRCHQQHKHKDRASNCIGTLSHKREVFGTVLKNLI